MSEEIKVLGGYSQGLVSSYAVHLETRLPMADLQSAIPGSVVTILRDRYTKGTDGKWRRPRKYYGQHTVTGWTDDADPQQPSRPSRDDESLDPRSCGFESRPGHHSGWRSLEPFPKLF